MSYAAQWQKTRYAFLREKGLCVKCGAVLVPAGKARCEACRAAARESRRLRRQEWINAGLCQRCGKVRVDEPGARCETCVTRTAEQVAAWRRKRQAA